jgi:hypothetical protein
VQDFSSIDSLESQLHMESICNPTIQVVQIYYQYCKAMEDGSCSALLQELAMELKNCAGSRVAKMCDFPPLGKLNTHFAITAGK